jgi:hypothetical protein
VTARQLTCLLHQRVTIRKVLFVATGEGPRYPKARLQPRKAAFPIRPVPRRIRAMLFVENTMQEPLHWKDGQTRHHTVFGRLSTRSGRGERVIFVTVTREPHGVNLRWLLHLFHQLTLARCFDATKTPTRPEKQIMRPLGTGLRRRFHFSGRSCLGCTARHLL